MSLKGKVVAITGASSGIGQATAEVLAAVGAKVALGARRGDRLEAVAAAITAKGGEAAWQVVDVVSRKDNAALVALAETRFGRLDAFVANAGVMLALVETADRDEWDRMSDVNLRGLVSGVAAALPALRRVGKSHVVTIASVAGLKALPGCAVYCATKFGVRAFSESLRQEVGAAIRVTIVSPGAIDTELPSHVTDEATIRGLDAAYAVALKPTAIADAMAFALGQPPEVDVNEITVRPTSQDLQCFGGHRLWKEIAMIELYFWPTPNGYKPLILLQELGLEYQLKPVDIFKGAQHAPSFLRLSPNGRMPAIVDIAPEDGGPPVTVFESGAILSYLARKSQRLARFDARGWSEIEQWVYWQMAGLGPMMGQAGHFLNFAPEDVPYAKARYVQEARRLFGVLDARIGDRAFIVDDYSIADIASYPWIRIYDFIGVALDDYPNLAAWAKRIGDRAAVKRAYDVGEPFKAGQLLDEAAREALFPART